MNSMRRNIAEQFILRKIVDGRGHDGNGLVCDIYIGKTFLGNYNDDGHDGITEVDFISDEYKEICEKIFDDNNYGQIMFDSGWAFVKDASEISFNDMMTCAIEDGVKLVNDFKILRKIARQCRRCVVYGDNIHKYKKVGWKNVGNINKLMEYSNGLTSLQKAYDDAKASGEKIYNDLGVLKKFGVKL